MIQSMQKFRRNVAYPLVVAMALYTTGCATSTSRSVRSVRTAPHKGITFVDKTPRNLAELSDAVKDDEETVEYMKRFGEIKNRVNTDKNYDPQGDIRSLHGKIQRKSNNSNLSNVLEDFGVYKDERIIEKTKVAGEDGFFNFLPVIVGTTIGPLYVGIDNTVNDRFGEESYNGLEEIGKMVLISAVIGGLTYLVCRMLNIKDKREYDKRTFINPYSGKEKQIR